MSFQRVVDITPVPNERPRVFTLPHTNLFGHTPRPNLS
jgi:hypothetical protein